MNYWNKFVKPILFFSIYLISIPILLTIFNLIKIETNRIIVIVTSSIIMLVTGFILGKKTNKNGYLNGLVLSSIIILLLLIISLIFRYNLNTNSIIYYAIMVISTILGSVLGINKKANNNK